MGIFSMFLFISLILLQTACFSSAYKSVIIIHGLLDGASDLKDLQRNIEQFHPGTEVHAIDLFDYYDSFQPLWRQTEKIRNVTDSIMASAKDGVHMIGYSQGGLIARGIIQTTDNHNVDTFIALSSPLNGQYGDTSYFNWLFPNTMKEDMYRIFYTELGQKLSIGNYWKDPHELERYAEYSEYLAQLNNETVPERSRFKYSWKTNFERLNGLVLIGGPNDGVISPWQSAQFGCYDENENVKLMRELEIYKRDTFGLQSLDKADSIMECVVPNITHRHWHGEITVFHKCIEPFLT